MCRCSWTRVSRPWPRGASCCRLRHRLAPAKVVGARVGRLVGRGTCLLDAARPVCPPRGEQPGCSAVSEHRCVVHGPLDRHRPDRLLADAAVVGLGEVAGQSDRGLVVDLVGRVGRVAAHSGRGDCQDSRGERLIGADQRGQGRGVDGHSHTRRLRVRLSLTSTLEPL